MINKKKLVAYTFVAIMVISAFAGITSYIPANLSFQSQIPSGTGSSISETSSVNALAITVSVPYSTYDEGQSITFTVNTTTSSFSTGCSDYLYIDNSCVAFHSYGGRSNGHQTFTYSYTPSSTSSISFYAHLYGGSCGSTSTPTGTITVNSDPTVTVSSSQNPTDVGNSVTFTATASGGSGSYTYQWYVNSATVSGATSSTYTTSFNAAGSYNVSVVATDSSGYSVSSYIMQSVNPALTISISPTYNPSDIGQDITYDTSVGGGSGTYSSYSYVLYDGTSKSNAELTSGTTSSFSYTYSTTGSFLLTYSVTDSVGDTA
jgi:hypothetical protein